ncbi:MAG TPA: helix-turn-helix domain-containing protein [Acidimicrobiia bacterium]
MHGAGSRTRENILDAAERLFAERGVPAVSMREIRIASGAKNTAAVQFHFGNREGLLEALIARHMPDIGARQQELADAARGDDTRALVDVLVRPIVEYLERGPSEAAWVKIMGELGGLPDLHLAEMFAITPEAGRAAAAALVRHVERIVPRDIARERIIMMAEMSVHQCGVYARLIHGPDSRPHLEPAAFADNLVDMLHAALLAPASEADEIAVLSS